MKTPTKLTTLAIALATLAIGTPAAAAEDAPRTEERAASRFHVDLETDPTAFVFRGYSLHAGLGWRHVRLFTERRTSLEELRSLPTRLCEDVGLNVLARVMALHRT